ncbi:hypothetical protein HDZ31DRAFT_64886 [Schizophyllum fasciatum]
MPHSGKTHGHIPGIAPGTVFADRKELKESGVHAVLRQGIHAEKLAGGAYSVLVPAETAAIAIKMKEIECGLDKKGGKQVEHQVWTYANKALQTSYQARKPVRVIRGHQLASPYAPESGFRYDGLYRVTKVVTRRNDDGLKECVAYLTRAPGQPPLPPPRNVLGAAHIAGARGNAVDTSSSEEETEADEDDRRAPAVSACAAPVPRRAAPIVSGPPVATAAAMPRTEAVVGGAKVKAAGVGAVERPVAGGMRTMVAAEKPAIVGGGERGEVVDVIDISSDEEDALPASKPGLRASPIEISDDEEDGRAANASASAPRGTTSSREPASSFAPPFMHPLFARALAKRASNSLPGAGLAASRGTASAALTSAALAAPKGTLHATPTSMPQNIQRGSLLAVKESATTTNPAGASTPPSAPKRVSETPLGSTRPAKHAQRVKPAKAAHAHAPGAQRAAAPQGTPHTRPADPSWVAAPRDMPPMIADGVLRRSQSVGSTGGRGVEKRAYGVRERERERGRGRRRTDENSEGSVAPGGRGASRGAEGRAGELLGLSRRELFAPLADDRYARLPRISKRSKEGGI